MQNIWIINHYAKPYSGRHYKFAEILVKRNYKVKIVCASTSLKHIDLTYDNKKNRSEKDVKGISFSIIKARDYYGNGKERLKNMLEFSYGAYKSLKKEKKEKPDVIYASSVHPLNWVVGYLLAKKYKAKLIIETRDLWPETLIRMGRITSTSILAKILFRLEKFIYQKADHLIFTMPGGEKYLNERKMKYEKVSYINNGVDLTEFDSNAQSNIYTLPIEKETFNVVYTGSMGIANSLEVILEAAKYLKEKKYSNIRFHFFGDGYLKEELEQYVKDYQLSNVTYYGRVHKNKIPSILKQADLNIVTSQNLSIYDYGVSLNKLFEYFASGKPTLSNIPTPYNKVEKYNVGLTVKPDSYRTLAEGIIQLNNMNSNEYNQICINSRKTAEKFEFKNLTTLLEKTF